MSGARKRGLVRLAILLGLVGWLVVLAIQALFGGGSPSRTASVASASGSAVPVRLRAETSAMRLPRPLHGATAATSGDGVLVIGGADRSDVSTDQVLLLNARTNNVSHAGALISAMHDAAATSLGGRTLVFGGGASTGFDLVQELDAGPARQIGRMPYAASDLSAVTVDGAGYVLGGYDGQSPVDSILRTTDGRTIDRAGRLSTPVRYTAAAALGTRIYAFGGELGSGAATSDIQEFDTTTGRASIVGHLSQPVDHASAVVLGGNLYILGGRRNGEASDRILRFDASRRAVVPEGRLPEPVFDAAAGIAAGVGYLAGGIGAQGTSVDSIVALRQSQGH